MNMQTTPILFWQYYDSTIESSEFQSRKLVRETGLLQFVEKQDILLPVF